MDPGLGEGPLGELHDAAIAFDGDTITWVGRSTDAPDAPDVLAVLDAPKPPPQRVSLSAARLSRAREVLFLVAGESKREAIARWRAGEQLPASAISAVARADVLIESNLLKARAD